MKESKLYQTKEYLEQEYCIKGRSTVEIGKEFKVRPSTIGRNLKKWNLPIRKKKPRPKTKQKSVSKNDAFVKTKGVLSINDKTGKRYGRLIAIRNLGHIDRRYYWECKCDCGNIIKVATGHLTTGHTQSCGCYKSDVVSHNKYKGGKYITGEEFNGVFRGAEQRQIDFHITIEEIDNLYERQNKCCALSNRSIRFNDRRINHPQGKIVRGSASIDRIDSDEPYTIDNIQLLHKEVNMAKQSLSQQDFISLCREVTNNNGT